MEPKPSFLEETPFEGALFGLEPIGFKPSPGFQTRLWPQLDKLRSQAVDSDPKTKISGLRISDWQASFPLVDLLPGGGGRLRKTHPYVATSQFRRSLVQQLALSCILQGTLRKGKPGSDFQQMGVICNWGCVDITGFVKHSGGCSALTKRMLITNQHLIYQKWIPNTCSCCAELVSSP